jgi:hypothetical protein
MKIHMKGLYTNTGQERSNTGTTHDHKQAIVHG